MIYVGIDPGLSGAIAWILPDGTWEGADAPTNKRAVGRVMDDRAMLRLLVHLGTDDGQQGRGVHVTIEDVHSLPHDGHVGAFSFGVGVGLWRGIVRGLGYGLDRVSPQRWKHAMLTGMAAGKHSSIVLCRRLFPGPAMEEWLRGPRGAELDGRAEALLLAVYGRRMAKIRI